MKRVLVIVVSYNGRHWLERCLGSVCPAVPGDPSTSLGMTTDVYVWDNDSTDGSADFVASRFPQAKLLRSADNLGFSKPNNLAMQYALEKGYDYVYLLNQDAWLEEGALEKLVAAADAHPDYGVLSPLQMTDGYQSLDRPFQKILRGVNNDSLMPSASIIDVRRVMAAHWLVPTAVIKKVGLFDEDLFPHWGQDDDWCNRLHFYGQKVGVVPEARAVHDRALRQDGRETLVKRNYYTGSLVRLANPGRPLWSQCCFVCLFTFVKAVKYRSLLPFKYFREICRKMPLVKASRARSKGAR